MDMHAGGTIVGPAETSALLNPVQLLCARMTGAGGDGICGQGAGPAGSAGRQAEAGQLRRFPLQQGVPAARGDRLRGCNTAHAVM